MILPKRHILLASCFLITFTLAVRVRKASRKHLSKIKQLLNDEALKHQTVIQSDSVNIFDNIPRNPLAGFHYDELSMNNAEEYFQGDVDLSEQQAKIIEDQFVEGKRNKRKIGKSPLYMKWDKEIPISFDYADSIPFQTRQKIKSAIRLWQHHTCVRFEEGGPNVDRVEFFDGGGCSSFVGKVGGTQGISISTPGCDVVGIISHEIGHCLGVFHEQARPDQERHIAINYNNIPLSRWNNFQAIGENHAETHGLPYDTGSVMHYGSFGFASDPYTPTIRTLERVQQFTIGQRRGPSFLDFQAINIAYGCLESCPSISCLRNGYPNPNNCTTCACPDGLSGTFCEKVSPSNAQCGGIMFANKETKRIESPNYPSKFPLDTECYWIISAPIEGRVFLEFEGDFDFHCEDTCDKAYVEIKYHSDQRLTGARFCCSLLPKDRFISFKNEMIIIMKGYQFGGKGFRAKYWSNLGEPENVISPLSATVVAPREIPINSQKPGKNSTETTTTLLRRISGNSLFTRKPVTIETGRLLTTAAVTTTTNTVETTRVTSLPPTRITGIETSSTIAPDINARVTTSTSGSITLFPAFSTMQPSINPFAGVLISTNAPDIINSVLECRCDSWLEWEGECSQHCGGCGHRLRKRVCKKETCRREEKRLCNFSLCPEGTNFLINNSEFHILWRGCCVGLFRSGDQCSALEAESNPFYKIINTLFNIQDSKHNVTLAEQRAMQREH